MRRILPVLALSSLATVVVVGAGERVAPSSPRGPQEPAVDFTRDVRPILAEHCVNCHGPDRQEGALRLDRREDVFAMRDGYAAVIPGDAEDSELVYRIQATEEYERMPPPDAEDPLTAEQIATLRRWVEEGANWAEHWAYTAPERPPLPPVRDTEWARNALDRFVLARLEAAGLVPAAEADRATLLRRVSLDLIGLPPTPAELEAFLADDAPGAYERVVDRLLASPHYGERWAKPWLDGARYADSHGFTIDGGRAMWRYRDWVVDAMNRDLPFDAFTIEQLAGDLLPEPTRAQVLATGFHRNTQVNQEGGADDEQFRVAAVIDRVSTTASVWLGSTLACAQCHNHKYDPFTQRDFFRLYDFFNHTEDRGVLGGPTLDALDPSKAAEIVRIEQELDALRAERDAALRANAEAWTVLEPVVGMGSHGVILDFQPDGSLRATGLNAEQSSYEVVVTTDEVGITALRFEALADPKLPQGGPGRADNGNFVLSELRLEVAPLHDAGAYVPVEVASVAADFSQHRSASSHWPIEHAVDGDESTGWAILPETGKSHEAVFTLAEPIGHAGGSLIRATVVQHYGSRHVIGRLRLAATTRAEPPEPSPAQGEHELDARIAELEKARPRARASLVLRERRVPRPTHLFERGSFLDLGEPLRAAFPAVLSDLGVGTAKRARGERLTRLDLAQWLVHEDHPLTARVTVNRWWQEFFGVGLVATENDFGTRGALPTHPQLLDWLARELIAGGWSRKATHRQIVTSATYRQSSQVDAATLERDPRNELLGRQVRLRLGAELLRDAALHASGLLDPALGGAPVQPPQPAGIDRFTQSRKSWKASEGSARFRRSLYTRLWRSNPHPFLTTFDLPDLTTSCTRRVRSNTPLQALTMANDPMIVEIARGFAESLLAEPEAGRLERAFVRALGRAPDDVERRRLQAFLVQQRASFAAEPEAARALAAATAAAGADTGSVEEAEAHQESSAEDDADEAFVIELAAWTALTRVLLNLDEFLTRE